MKKKKFKTKLANLDSALWSYHIPVPKNVKEAFVEGKDRRVICRLNDTIEFPCAIMYKAEEYFFININKEIRKKLKLEIGTEVEVEIWKDNSEYGMPMPEELSEIFAMDPEADKAFHALTKGKQRNLIYLVSKPKNVDTRIRKAIAITEYLKTCKGKIDFKELNEAMKINRQ